jgi:arabinose-5-phosphate isomerase
MVDSVRSSVTAGPDTAAILDDMDRVFQLEIETLSKVRKTIGQDYVRAGEILFGCLGNVVVTGMGKSGLIGQKIAATMVSTGTRALFLDPADGLHGQVGIVREGDVVIAISKSGETEELLLLLPYMKRIEVPVISITAGPNSILAKSSDVVLFTPVDEEACPLNLAPTSSTTAALVVGDALAMALMNMRGFTVDQFAQLHPGGQLGKRLLLHVADIMRTGDNNPVVNIDRSLPDMLYEITRQRSGALSIVDDEGKLLGLVTDHDIRSVLEYGKDIFSLSIASIMNDKPTYISSDAMAVDALNLMENRERPFLVLPVLESNGERVVGMVHLHDLIANGL